MEEKQIDIIIPAFKVHETLYTTLCSIAQQTYKDKIKITVVNDCCPEGSYYKTIKKFKKDLDIEEIKMPKNGGPGLARQYGINNTNCPYIMFVDADDILLGTTAIEILYRGIIEQKTEVLFSSFIENLKDNKLIYHPADKIWLFGKIYKRDFLKKHNIYFNSMRGGEDGLFNRKVMLSLPNLTIPFIEDNYLYEWNHLRTNSITLNNSVQYSFDLGPYYLGKNLIELIKWAEKENIDKNILKEEIYHQFANVYFHYLQNLNINSPFTKQIYEVLKECYYKIWKKYDCDILSDEFKNAFYKQLEGWFSFTEHFSILTNQAIGLKDLFNFFEQSPYNKQDLIDFYEKEFPQHLKQANINCGLADEEFYKNGGYEEEQ